MQLRSPRVVSAAGTPAFIQPSAVQLLHGAGVGSSVSGSGVSRTTPNSTSLHPTTGAVTTAVLVAVSNQRRRRREVGSSGKGHLSALRVLSLGTGEALTGGRKARRAEMSRSYLHLLGEAERALLQALRERVPAVVANLRKASHATEHLTIWGVDIKTRSDASDMVLLKFLRAEELDVEKAVERLSQTLQFRADNAVDALVSEELPEHFQGHDMLGNTDVDGRPLMISRYGRMDNDKVFGDPNAFVRYRLQIMEKAMKHLRFDRGAPEDLCQIHDYSGVSLLFKSDEVKAGISAMTKVFSAHYPETKGKTLFVKFPLLFSKLFQAFSIFIPEKTRKKFIILGEADQALLFDHVPPEVLPEDMGGMLSPPGTPGRQLQGHCQVASVGARSSEAVDLLQVTSAAAIAWELRVCSQEVEYELFFVPRSGGEEQLVSKSSPGQPLTASQGVLRGEHQASEAGTLRCHFRNGKGWFQQRLCLYRAACLE